MISNYTYKRLSLISVDYENSYQVIGHSIISPPNSHKGKFELSVIYFADDALSNNRQNLNPILLRYTRTSLL